MVRRFRRRIFPKRRLYGSYSRYRKRAGSTKRRYHKTYRNRLFLGAGKKYANRSRFANRVSKVLRRRYRRRKIFKTGDLAKYKGVQAWASAQTELSKGKPNSGTDKDTWYNTVLTNIKIMEGLLWKEAKFVYIYRQHKRILPKLYHIASASRDTLNKEMTLDETTIPNENWKELKMIVRLTRHFNPQNTQWKEVMSKQKNSIQLATIFTVGRIGIQRMDNFLRSMYETNYMEVAGNILKSIISITEKIAQEFNIIPIISLTINNIAANV